MENNELQHHGTKGMKWGQRLYQNKDGSLTALGRARARYKKKQAVKKRAATIAAKKKAAEELKKKAEKEAAETANSKESVLKSRSAKELYDNANLFDDKELMTAYNRLVLEKSIQNLQPTEVENGREFMNKINRYGTSFSNLIGTGSKLYNQFASIYNAFSDGDPLPKINTGDGKDKSQDNGNDNGKDKSNDKGKDKSNDKGKDKPNGKGKDKPNGKGKDKPNDEGEDGYKWIDDSDAYDPGTRSKPYNWIDSDGPSDSGGSKSGRSATTTFTDSKTGESFTDDILDSDGSTIVKGWTGSNKSNIDAGESFVGSLLPALRDDD